MGWCQSRYCTELEEIDEEDRDEITFYFGTAIKTPRQGEDSPTFEQHGGRRQRTTAHQKKDGA
jgi:hypothetical protein